MGIAEAIEAAVRQVELSSRQAHQEHPAGIGQHRAHDGDPHRILPIEDLEGQPQRHDNGNDNPPPQGLVKRMRRIDDFHHTHLTETRFRRKPRPMACSLAAIALYPRAFQAALTGEREPGCVAASQTVSRPQSTCRLPGWFRSLETMSRFVRRAPIINANGPCGTSLRNFRRASPDLKIGQDLMAKSAVSFNPTREDFETLLAESFGDNPATEGSVVKGRVVSIENDFAIIDVGLKTEGKIAVKEFAQPGTGVATQGRRHGRSLSRAHRERAGRGGAVARQGAPRGGLDPARTESSAKNERVDGVIFGRVKGGFTVDLGGAVAFLPGSQVDVRPIRDVGPLMNVSQPFQILKMDRRRGNIVVSRRAIMEETRAEQRSELVQNLAEGQVVDGVVKNITDYGAFVDLGGIDGLLHVTDIAWKRVNHPSDVLHVGQTGQGADHPHQSRDPAHLARHEAARQGSVGRRGREISARLQGQAAGSPTSPTTAPSSNSRMASRASSMSRK